MNEVDTGNYQMVCSGSGPDRVGVMAPKGDMSCDEALTHAAWLAVMADPLGERFAVVLQAVRNS